MKAIVLEGKEQPFEIKEIEVPGLQAGQALVKIHAAAFNHRDLWIQKGQYAGLKYPIILGSDGSGVVSAVADEKDQHWIGKEVIINPSLNWNDESPAQSREFKILGLPDNGTFAEYAVVPAANLYNKPTHLGHEQAAATPLAGLTAYRALFSRGKLLKGETVLITGIGGGVALFVLQFAVAQGARVFVTSGSNEKIDRAIALGAAGGANYNALEWDKELMKASGGFEVIIDSAAGEGFNKLVDMAKPGARIVFYGGTNGNFQNLSPQKIFWKQLNLLGSTMGNSREFGEMVAFIAEHQIMPAVDKVFDYTDAQNAIGRMNERTQFGKIVLKFV
jgi:zinc-binding alcohol dehydrogenase/oxidoreductase